MATKPNQALIYRQVPPFLRHLRKESGQTQRGLAERMGRTQWWVARTETGSRRMDIAEFIEWSSGCGIEPTAALTTLMDRRPSSANRRRGNTTRGHKRK